MFWDREAESLPRADLEPFQLERLPETVDCMEQAERSLRTAGFRVFPLEASVVEVPSQPGAPHALAEALSQHQVNLDCFSGSNSGARAILVIKTEGREKARTLLASRGWRVLSQDDLSAPA